MYVNNTLYTSGSVLTKADWWLGIWYTWWGSSSDRLSWEISEFILEDRAWTATEISDYFNATKSNYWIS
jgi:hypothetical protein